MFWSIGHPLCPNWSAWVGQSAESFAWAAVFIRAGERRLPPDFRPAELAVQRDARPPDRLCLEGMRAILAERRPFTELAAAFALSAAHLVIGFRFQWFFRSSRRAGTFAGAGRVSGVR